jgi:hypothetical protein
MREQYVTPVGFAKEPTEVRRRWIGRILLLILIVFIGYVFFTKVIHPPEDNPRLPAPSQLPNA